MNGYSQNSISSLRQIWQGLKALKNFHLSDLRKVFSLMGKTEKFVLTILIAAAIMSLGISVRGFYLKHTQPAPALGGSLTEGMLGQPQYINPLLALSDTDQSLTKLVFSGLYKYGSSGELEADLADGMPQISDDQKSYTVSLKPNAHWHNQKPVTADDVVFTLQTLKNPDFKSPLRNLWLSTSVEKISDTQVRFTSKDISGPFIYNLTLPILPKDVWSSVDAGSFLLNKANLEAIGSGPYSISQINKLPSGKIQSIILKSFQGYHNNRPNIETLVLKFYDTDEDLLNGLRGREIDLAGITAMPNQDLSGLDKNFTALTLPLPQYQIAYFNLSDGLMSQDFIRKALSMATDRGQILQAVFQNHRYMPNDPLTKNPDNSASLNLDAANLQLTNAGWIMGADALRHKKDQVLSLTISTSDSPANMQTGKFLQKQWQVLGIKVNLDIKPAKQLTDEVIRTRQFQVLIFSQKFGSDPDPFFFWHSSQAKDPGLNLTGLSDANLDKLLTDARNTTNSNDRSQKYAAISQIINAKAPEILLNQNNFIYFVNPKIQNIGLKALNDATSRFYDLPNWYLQTKRVRK